MRSVSRFRASAPVLVAGALWLSGCGGTAKEQARKLQVRSIMATTDPVASVRVSESEIANAPRGSVQRAFLQYWSDAQFEGWLAVAQTYEPGLRQFVGQDALVQALTGESAIFRSSRPEIASVTLTVRGARALVRFYRVDTKEKVASSISWIRRAGGRWLIRYDPLLDRALSDLRQFEAQRSIDPLALTPAPAALRAGARASRLQSDYLAQAGGAEGTADAPAPRKLTP